MKSTKSSNHQSYASHLEDLNQDIQNTESSEFEREKEATYYVYKDIANKEGTWKDSIEPAHRSTINFIELFKDLFKKRRIERITY